MTLIDIKHYFLKQRMASLAAMSVHFHKDPTVIRSMLEHWIRKGALKKCMKTPACGQTCVKCDTTLTEIYQWVAL